MSGTNDPNLNGLPDTPLGTVLAPIVMPQAPTPPKDDADEREARDAELANVKRWEGTVQKAIGHWKTVFDRMREDQDFAYGIQWQGQKPDANEDRYIVNIVQRHVAQRVAALYAKNPHVVARSRPRMTHTIWDGTSRQLQEAMQIMVTNPMAPEAAIAAQIIADAQASNAKRRAVERVGDTLAHVYEIQIDRQALPFKTMLKATARRAVTTAVGYVKLGYQRPMQTRPEASTAMPDDTGQLATVERLNEDMTEGEITPDSAEAEDLAAMTANLSTKPQLIQREGLVFDYPDSTAIIPDPKCKMLSTFLGCDWVAEEYMMAPEKVEETYKVSLDSKFKAHTTGGGGTNDGSTATIRAGATVIEPNAESKNANGKDQLARVWEIYDRTTGLCLTICEGHPNYLKAPAPPDVKLSRFYPWFAYVLNEMDHASQPYPNSDVRLIRHPQLEVNRSRQGLREHRKANRPKTIVAGGVLDDMDKAKLKDHPANAIIELNGLQPNQKVDDLLQPMRPPGVDPNLYEVGPFYSDVLRSVGTQTANIGGTSGATATETSIAQASQQNDVDAAMADMDALLSELARAGGEVLLANMSKEQVTQLVGEGAVWPDLDMGAIVDQVWLEVEAGSSGAPNAAQEVQNMQMLMPLLLQIPGISPEWLANRILRALDSRVDLSDAFSPGLPSIQAINTGRAMMEGGGPPGMAMPAAAGRGGGVSGDPNAQGPQGANNAPGPQGPPQGAVPRPAMPQPGAGAAAAGGGQTQQR